MGLDLKASRVKYGANLLAKLWELVHIAKHHLPSTLLDQHAHHGGFDCIDLLHSSIHNSINNGDTHIILYGMGGHFMLLSAAQTSFSSEHISKIDILSLSTLDFRPDSE